MDRKYLAIIGVAAGVAIGFAITLFGSLNATEAQIKFSPAEEGTIESGLIPPSQTVGRTFTAGKHGKMFVEFNVKSAGPAKVSYWMKSPTGEMLLTTPKITSSNILKINEHQSYALIPMRGSPDYEDLSGSMISVNYARMQDLATDLDGSLALAERGGAEGDGEISFLEKQANVASKGAKALIVFNNNSGQFYGDLISALSDQQPIIPTFSISREDGLELKKLIDEKGVVATITDTGNQSNEFTLPYASFDINIYQKGVYEIWFHNDGPSNALVTVKYVFRQG